ncbi:hypothetical protein AWB80_07531 [Caballeronia pedi]|uniref:Uncharacterized protein n=1 Tax=Caballeronia pedi TaxID=1777141 RepID=A0A158DV02_9BURK|nr:hypothetical protein [Caballeronia pedi]SAK98479.1 hypothetical protein AWB80_07531 [Caballeronia pedi]
MARPALARPRILELLSAARHPMTREQIADELEMTIGAVKDAVRSAKKARLVYIADWYRPPIDEHGRKSQMLALGNKPDVPEPRLTGAQYSRRTRQRHNAVYRVRESIRRHGYLNPYLQLLCRSAPKKPRSATA